MLANHTSGMAKTSNVTCTTATTGTRSSNDPWCDMAFGPWNYVPSVGFSDIEPRMDATGNRITGEFICTTDNGFGNSANSWDYPLHLHHMRIQKPFTFRHGGSTFPTYTETTSLGVVLLRDPNNLVRWENGADIQVTYAIPDATWNDWRSMRVLTGRDFDIEGLAVRDANYGERSPRTLWPTPSPQHRVHRSHHLAHTS